MKAIPKYFRRESEKDNGLHKKLSNARNRFRNSSIKSETVNGTTISGNKSAMFENLAVK